MTRVTKLSLIIAVVILVPGMVSAQINFNGGVGLKYVHSASTLEQGFLILSSHSRSFGTPSNEPNNSYTVWDISGRVLINYGLSKHVELSITPLLYQDTNRPGNKINTPDDFFAAVKVGSFSSPGSSISYGFLVNARIPTGKTHNIPWETYNAGRVSGGVTGLLSYSQDPLYPEEALNAHFNLGYWNHNDVGADLGKGEANTSIQPESMSQELIYGVGVKFPKDKISFTAEVNGNFFLQAPPVSAYSRENYLYFAPGVEYKPVRWLSVGAGADIRVAGGSDKTLYNEAAGGVSATIPGQPNYPAWRINMGVRFTFLTGKSRRPYSGDLMMQKAETRRELFEQIIREQKATESAEGELERIRAERIRAEKELERLRRILEGETEKSAENEFEQDQSNDDN